MADQQRDFIVTGRHFHLRHVVCRLQAANEFAQPQQVLANGGQQGLATANVGHEVRAFFAKPNQQFAALDDVAHAQPGAAAIAPLRPDDRRQNAPWRELGLMR